MHLEQNKFSAYVANKLLVIDSMNSIIDFKVCATLQKPSYIKFYHVG